MSRWIYFYGLDVMGECHGAGQAQASPRLSLDDGLVSGHLVKSGQILDLMGICSTYEYIGP